MQKTDNFQFNLIEDEDAFSPAPLNENMEKVEDQLEQLIAAFGPGSTSAHIIWGSYVSQSIERTLILPFKPLAVILTAVGSSGYYDVAVLVRGCAAVSADLNVTAWGNNSVTYEGFSETTGSIVRTVYYVAIGMLEGE